MRATILKDKPAAPVATDAAGIATNLRANAPSKIEPAPNARISLPKGLQAPEIEDVLAAASDEQINDAYMTDFAAWALWQKPIIDGREPFSFGPSKRAPYGRRFLVDIYVCRDKKMVWEKPAQVGATTYQQLFLIWYALSHQCKAGLYFPGKDELGELVADRFTPLVDSNKHIADRISKDVDKVSLKRIRNYLDGESSMYFRNIGGKSAKDAIPLDMVMFDEVRLFDDVGDIAQVLKRMQGSDQQVARLMSTAGYEGVDIDYEFKHGTQHIWLSRCRCQDNGVDLAEVFPECLASKGTGKSATYYYRCPRCKTVILDPQNGAWVPRMPDADYTSFNCSALLTLLPEKVWKEYTTTQNLQEFHRATLGRPYLDAANVPITDSILDACTNPDIARWAIFHPAERALRLNCVMGMDQGGNNHIVIARRRRDGTLQPVHIEVVDPANQAYWVNGKRVTPFARARQLMQEFNVQCCIADHFPNTHDAVSFAQEFPGRVFLAVTGASAASVQLVRWMDRDPDPNSSDDVQTRWVVKLNRYNAVDHALGQFGKGNVVMPHAKGITQLLRSEDDGALRPEYVGERFRKHLKNLIRHKEVTNKETGQYRMEWRHKGPDHFGFAWTYCVFAASRAQDSGGLYWM